MAGSGQRRLGNKVNWPKRRRKGEENLLLGPTEEPNSPKFLDSLVFHFVWGCPVVWLVDLHL